MAVACSAFAIWSATASAAEVKPEPTPQWSIFQIFGTPTVFEPGSKEGAYQVSAFNIGGGVTNNEKQIIMSDQLPEGVKPTYVEFLTVGGDYGTRGYAAKALENEREYLENLGRYLLTEGERFEREAPEYEAKAKTAEEEYERTGEEKYKEEAEQDNQRAGFDRYLAPLYKQFGELYLRFAKEVGEPWCRIEPSVVCEYPGHNNRSAGLRPFQPGQIVYMVTHFEVEPGTEGPLVDSGSISGGGAGNVSATSSPNEVGTGVVPPFGYEGYEVATRNRDRTQATAAGAHPFSLDISAGFNNKIVSGTEGHEAPVTIPVEEPHKTVIKLPPGLVANPYAVPRCKLAEFWSGECPPNAQVGTIDPYATFLNLKYPANQVPVYNIEPENGNPADLGFLIIDIPFLIKTEIDTAGDYSISSNTESPGIGLNGFSLELWGVPAAEHPRGLLCGYAQYACQKPTGGVATVEPTPYLRNSTNCSVSKQVAETFSDSWENFGVFTAPFTSSMDPPDGCNQVPFEPSWQAHTSTDLADAPSGLDTDLHVAQSESPTSVSTSDVRNISFTLPQGVSLNPAADNGRVGCTMKQFGLHSAAPSECPNASKIGEVEVNSPLENHPLPGSVYLANQGENPFGSIFAFYVVVDDPISGVIIKLPAEVTPDPRTGQLTTRFENAPQLPFEDFKLHLFGGSGGVLRTPSVCGTYGVTSAVAPYSAPSAPAVPTASFDISGAAHGNCPQTPAQVPSAPVFHAGTESPQAGHFSPFAFRLSREDGTREFSSVETTLPAGLIAKLAGVPYCSSGELAAAAEKTGRQEEQDPSCPTASQVGTVNVGTGVGPNPIYVQGHAYLTGPYKGAPLGLAVITPAVAGPFDLGNTVVRVALHVDPETAQVRAVSDPLPTILQGVPLDIRSIALKLDRPEFTLNPTSCESMSFGGNALSVGNAISPLFARFQVGGCKTLPFKPRLGIKLLGSVKRTGHPSLRAVLIAKPGESNVAMAQVALPHTEQLDQGHLNKTCSRSQLASHTCPASSIYGYAKAFTPLTDKPLEGPVYLGTGFGHKLPDVVADLNGQIEILLHGKVDSDSEEGLRNTFEVVPDAPVSKFVLTLQGGKKGLLENSTNICVHRARAKVELEGHNGKVHDTEPLLQVPCHARHNHHGSHHHHGRAAG